ncbi:DNA-binding protein [Candidatus Nomurabacteria bacterium RIFCSPLOWO2_01_FULL_42_20]|uniref:DNA-binding protein n=1 Tax=Candidatus Nomurabacteria bacterium RIFCSPHIGHO2_01_FULL_42_16 TaxID=1801743 RepID=A0A1F6VI24_9BACT|nr:MAG: DNA-binding protein [Candidatus Nomurabacteria bacterium RIFCSPHIGHO2_01_FULL_42_16]OGI92468.1 MAG: DNA-binding protein [Candidatus Nomurabacteria bacterium RIFCSPLOWO2_01_FULL_42_20]
MSQAKKEITIVPFERIINRIFLFRGKKVMIDRDLAELYEVETRILNQAVRRNFDRFPSDFMFQLSKQETNVWKSQIVISTAEKKGLRKRPLVFTEQGVAMLSSVLNSERAIQVNIQIIRTFTKLRELLATNTKIRHKIEQMEKKYDSKLRQVFDILKQLLMQESKTKPQIGFKK